MIKSSKLSTLGEFKNGLNYAKHEVKNPMKIIGIPDFGERIVPDYKTLAEVDESFVPSDYYLQNGDIVFVRSNGNSTLVGRTMIIENIKEKIGYSGFCIRFRVTDTDIDPYYLLYYLKSPIVREQLSRTRQSNINNINQDMLGNLLIRLPNLSEQSDIARVISNIDRKIALNNRINTELENMARLLYDYWFVQFDFPNAEGKPYRQSGGEMVWNKDLKREIPKGWNVTRLERLASFQNGINYEKNNKIPTAKIINVRDISNSSFFILTDYCDAINVSDIEIQRYEISNSDILIARSGIPGAVRLIHKTEENVVFCGFSIKLKLHDIINKMHLYFTLKQIEESSLRASTGTIMKNISQDTLKQINVILPPSCLLSTFNTSMENLTKMLIGNLKQNKALAEQRDFLLPLLMNGQVTVVPKSATVEAPALGKVSSAEEKRRAVFKRLVLSAYILDVICDEPTAGRVKFEKLLYLSEYCAQIPLHSEFRRAAAGPYDAKALYGIENQLEKSKWFKCRCSKSDSRAYARMDKSKNYLTYVDSNFDDIQRETINRLLRLFKTQRTIQCEIVATLYGAWNDFLLEGSQPTDDQIVDDVMTNWHESKERIARSRWIRALNWMRQEEIVPVGYGVLTKRDQKI